MTRLLHLTTSLLVVASVILFANAAPAMPHSTNPDSSPAPSFALYAQTANALRYVKLDPRTLIDQPDTSPVNLDDFYLQAWSEDGSRVVTIENQLTVVVRDGQTNAELQRFKTPELVYLARLSRDGTRLVVGGSNVCYDSGCDAPRHYVYDTRDGHLVSKIVGTGKEYFIPLIDRDAGTLYVASTERGDQIEGSWPLDITAYDLTSGTERGTVTLSDVLVTIGPLRSDTEEPVRESFTPAITLSNDGTRLAAVDAIGSTVAVVETASMSAKTYSIHHPESTLTKAARWIGLVPMTAEAKYMDGRYMNATFSADANLLYFWGIEGTFDAETREQSGQGFGLTMIDLRNGEIRAESFEEHFVQQVRLSPDGLDLYVIETPDMAWSSTQVPYTLHRLDPQTLEPRAERQFPGYVWIELAPSRFKTP